MTKARRLRLVRLTGAVAGIVTAMLFSVPAGAEEACVAGDDAWQTTVVDIVDGDTLRVDGGRVVRLAGIDAPKPPLGMGADAPWPPADAASVGLRDLAGGKTVLVAPLGEEPDRYGRWRAQVFADDGDTWLQSAMVGAGLARARWLPGDPPCVFALLAVEGVAREAGLGLWAISDYAVWEASDLSLIDRTGLYEVVEGRVASVGHGDYMIFVDFGREYWRDFSVMIAPPVAKRFGDSGVSLDELVGRRVRVRGLIESSGGPAIRLNDPAELEVLDDNGGVRN